MDTSKMYFTQMEILWKIFSETPGAVAHIRGSRDYPQLKGVAQFYQVPQGVLAVTEMLNLPTEERIDKPEETEKCKERIYAQHIHNGSVCAGNAQDPFADAGMHLNPEDCGHPYHAGDMPPLFENGGYALTVFVTNRFKLTDILGKTIVVHERRDDFTTQPAGASGKKIACGVIQRVNLP